MEYYQVFSKVVLKEIKHFNLKTEVYSTFVSQLTASLDGNFDVSYNRCAYMYKYASNCTYFFKDCINLFLSDFNDAKDMLSEWKYYSEVNVCSLSIGPGLDYLAFVLAILENDPLPPNFAGAKVISKHGAWRNTVNFLLEVLREQGSIFEIPQSKLKYDDTKVIQADLFKCFLEKQTIVSLSEAHVVLMMKTLNLLAAGTPQEGPILNMLKGLISSLKSDAVIFCIDTKPSLALLSQALSNFPGKFLYGPTYRTIKLPVDFPEIEGCRPAVNSRGAFFVWKKLPSYPSMMNLSTSLDTTSVVTEYKSKLPTPCDNDISSVSRSIKHETIEDDSDNVPWIELKTFWESSSPTTKKMLKKLMLSDTKSLEQIGDQDFPEETVDIKKNEHLNIARTKLLEGIEVLSSVSKGSALVTDKDVKCTYDDYSDWQNSSVGGTSFDTVDIPSSIEPPNSVNSLIYKNATSCSEIEEMDPVSDIKKQNCYDAQVRIKVDSGEAIISSDDAGFSPDQKVKTTNALNNNYTSSTSTEKLSEQINYFVNVSCNVPNKNNPINMIDSEGHTIGKDAEISSHEKIIQTDSQECTNSTSLKKLADGIRRIVSSLESITQQNEATDYEICNGSPNNTHNQHCFAPNCNIYNNAMPSCSKHSTGYGHTDVNNLPSYECNMQSNNRCHCCHNRCNIMQPHCCYNSCNFQPCLHSVPICNFSCNKMPCGEHNVNFMSPNIVIPVQNISEEAMLKILSLLKSGSKSS